MKMKMRLSALLLALIGLFALAGCSTAGETDAEIEALRGEIIPEAAAPAISAEEALEKGEDFMNDIAPDAFYVTIHNSNPQEVGDKQVYLMTLTLTEGAGAAVYEPALAMDAESGILYSHYADGTLIPAADDVHWDEFDLSYAILTPEEQESITEAELYAAELTAEGEAGFVLTMKTGRYAYADENAVYVGYEGDIYQTLFHDGYEGSQPDETGLLARDVNFDGAEDLLLCKSKAAGNGYYYLWLFDPAEGTYIRYPDFEQLCTPSLNPDTGIITTAMRDGEVSYANEVWRWDESGTLIRESRHAVEQEESGKITVSSTDSDGTEASFTVTREEYDSATELMSGKLVDFALIRFGGSETRTFTFEGLAEKDHLDCYSILMNEGGEPITRLYIDQQTEQTVMVDADRDGAHEETLDIYTAE